MNVDEYDLAVARWIHAFNTQKGYSPTVREVQEAMGVGSSSTAHVVMKRLEGKGYIHVGTVARRRITVTIPS
jgi:SOS-response transcriptional repressor LexA